MVTINGKKYKINMDIKWGTQKLLKKIQENPENMDNLNYLETIVMDLLRPKPTKKAIDNFRNSDLEKVFSEFNKDVKDVNTDFKKKLSQ